MQRIIKFLIKNQTTLIYFTLLIISFSINIKKDYNKRISFFKQLENITNKIHIYKTSFTNYIHLKKINEILINENAKIKSINNLNNKNKILYNNINYIPCNIVYNSTNYRQNYIIINKGKEDGIEKGMGVVSSKSVVGIIVETNKNYSKVMSILNSDFKISGKFKKNNYSGIIEWDQINIKKGSFSDFPIHAKITKGDTIVTSGYSLLFPANIIIGTVDKVDEKNKILFSFYEDYNKIKYAYIIKSNDMQEIKKMLNE